MSPIHIKTRDLSKINSDFAFTIGYYDLPEEELVQLLFQYGGESYDIVDSNWKNEQRLKMLLVERANPCTYFSSTYDVIEVLLGLTGIGIVIK